MKSRVETGVIVWIILVINKLFFMIFSVIFLLGFATVSYWVLQQSLNLKKVYVFGPMSEEKLGCGQLA